MVAEAAADGSGPKPGTRVVGLVEAAGWAELVAVPTSRLAVLPDGVAVQDAATLPLAGLTTLRTLRLGGDLLGRRVLVTGASGAVGRFQIQLAAAAGARVTAVTRATHAQQLAELGAERVIAEPAAAGRPGGRRAAAPNAGLHRPLVTAQRRDRRLAPAALQRQGRPDHRLTRARAHWSASPTGWTPP